MNIKTFSSTCSERELQQTGTILHKDNYVPGLLALMGEYSEQQDVVASFMWDKLRPLLKEYRT